MEGEKCLMVVNLCGLSDVCAGFCSLVRDCFLTSILFACRDEDQQDTECKSKVQNPSSGCSVYVL